MGFFTNIFGLMHDEKKHSGVSTEERRKMIYVLMGIIVSLPVLIGYGLFAWFDMNRPVDAFLNLFLAGCFLIIAILIKQKRNMLPLYRFGSFGLVTLLIYNVGFGSLQESCPLWLLVFPHIAFYLFGKKEGLIWIFTVILPSALLIFFPYTVNANIYPVSFRIALSIVIVFSVVLSYLLEALRAHFYSRLEKQNKELQKALAEVKKLSGLIPICSLCKKIRDDKGFWNQIEEYIRDRSEAEFSHGMCPDCIDKFYPGFTSE